MTRTTRFRLSSLPTAVVLALAGCDEAPESESESESAEHADIAEPCAGELAPGRLLSEPEVARRLGAQDLALAPAEPAPRGEHLTIEEIAAREPDPQEGIDPTPGDSPTPIDPLFPLPIYTGTYVQRAYYEAPLRIVRLCDTDGTNCSVASKSGVQSAIDWTNALHYRSDSKLRFKIDPATDFVGHLKSDSLNNDCKPKANLGSYPQDANGDGVVNDADAAFLCPSVWDGDLATTYGALIETYGGAIPMYSRAGAKAVEWDPVTMKWVRKQISGGSSSCGGHSVNMTSSFNGSTFMAHELGHYFCSPHTFSGTTPANTGEAATQIRNHVAATPLEPWHKPQILDQLYNGDLYQYGGDVAYVNNWQILDSPPDPRATFMESVNGAGTACEIGDMAATFSVWFPAPYNAIYSYTLDPDRRNVMSYFKGCFGDYHYLTPDQIARAHGVAVNHRDAVTTTVWVDGWENALDITIPPRPDLGTGPLKWVSSYIKTAGGAGNPTRVKVHVDIKHDEGCLNIKLVAPNNLEYTLQSYSANCGKVAGDVKTIFNLAGAGLPKDGTWTLKVAAQYTQLEDAVRKIDDWRIEFE